MSDPSGNPFWDYSLALYGREEVAKACLALQDRLGLDVNMVLFCCWAGSRGRRLRQDEIGRLTAATRAWRDEVVLPLRAARRWLKAQAPQVGPAALDLREDIKASELAAEAVQQDLLRRELPVPEGAPSAPAAAANLRLYLAASDCRADSADIEDLATVLCGACPDLGAMEARDLLTG